ncbi:MAG: helix-turn-helix domain-containing protein [Chloroflexota bacterium]
MPNFKSNKERSVTPGKPGRKAAPSTAGLENNPPGTTSAERGKQQSRSGGSFAARFGRIILQDGIATVPSAMLHYQGTLEMSAQQVWFVSYILAHKWDEDLPYPSLKAMAKRVGMSLSQLQRIKNTLCEMGYLKVYPRYTEKQGQATNAYDFSGLFDRLEELIMQDAPLANSIRVEDDNPPDMAELGQVDPSFVARYGRVITRRGVAAVPRAIFTHQAALTLTPQQVWFITYIFSFQWDTSLPYPSIRRMSSLTGYSSVQLHTIKAELVEHNYLRLVHRANEQGGQDTNAYDFSGLLDRIRELLQPGAAKDDGRKGGEEVSEAQSVRPAVRRRGRKTGANVPGQGRTELAEGGSVQLTGGDSSRLGEGGRIELSRGDSVQLLEGGSIRLAEGDRTELTERGSRELPKAGNGRHSGGTSVRYSRGVARGLHEIESGKEETTKKKVDSNQRANGNGFVRNENEVTPPPYSPYVASVISDFSNELNDPTHVISNVTQALRLWQTSGLDEQHFTELLYEAKRITRSYQGKQGLNGMNNKMAYFFKVVRDLCG